MKQIALLAAVVALGLATAASATPTTEAPAPESAAPITVPATDLAVLTGRWKWFFGQKICWGQVVHLPGESQCV